MELLLIRHALPHRVELESGRADPALTPEGEAQAAALGNWLAAEAIDAVYSSPLRRALQTARPIAENQGLEPTVDPEVAEFDRDASSYIPIEEMAKEEIAELVAGAGFAWSDDPSVFRNRAVTAVEHIVVANPSRRVAVVCHGGIINAYLGHILGISELMWFQPTYTGIARVLASRSGHRQIDTLNERAHLAGIDGPR